MKKEDKNNKIILNVAETYHSDVGHGLVRIDKKTIQLIGGQIGDFILI